MAGPPSPEHWYAALSSPYGVVLVTDNPLLAKQRLYAIRKALADPDLDAVSIMTSPASPFELWLVKTERERGRETL